MKHILLTLLLLLSLKGYSQPPCGSNPAAGESCATATPICELNGYCGNTSSSYAVDTWSQSCGFLGLFDCGLSGEFCGSIENNSFLSFVASSSSITFNCWVYNSTYGDGIQIMIFSANNCSGTVTSYYCSQLAPSAGSQTVSASGLTPGNTYYIMIDGFAGDVCDYTFAATSGVSIPVDINPANSTICVGESVSLTATGGGGTYTWNASPDLSTTSGASVTATPPSTPGTYTYTVSSSTGNSLCPSSASATATIVVNPCGCSVTATNSGNVCAGTGTINLFATTITGATYSWTGPNGFTSSAQNPASVPVPATPGTYTFTVDVTDNGSVCSSTTTVTVYALPAVDAGAAIAVCAGGSVTLSGTGAQTYSWDNGATNGVSFVPLSNQTYTVTGTDANGCQNTDQVTLTVNPLPVISAGLPQSICLGEVITLAGSGAQTYVWSNSVTNGLSFIPGATQTYTVTGTDANGCSNTGQVTITVNPLPVVEAGLPQSVCQGSPVTLTGSGAQTYTWNNGGIDGVPFTPGSTSTYICTGTDANGCQNTDQVLVTVNPIPTVNAGADQSVCIGGNVTLTASGASNYSWNNGVTNGVAFVPGATQTYTVTVTANGCQASDQVVVTVNPLPNVNAGVDQSICAGDEIILSGSGAQTYSWNNGAVNGISFAPGSTQTYTVTGTDANGCVNTDQLTVTVVPVPVADVSADVLSGPPTLTVNFDNNSSNASGYHWAFGTGAETNSATTAGQQYQYTNPGEYTVILTAANGSCVDSDTLKILVEPIPDPVVVIPNIFTPNGDGKNDVFFIRLENAASVEVTIVNRWGNKMVSFSGVNSSWDGTVNGNLAEEGVYFFNYTATGLNGTTLTGQGNVQLLRD
ncbi:gliding motility-associated C-terminal domain-containing protein [Fluviicola sp.]|uniref:T9SS type B sorting domain-containing protein n=1 Tax=Fluviicola sp. TaxID=1917219 RepID=UPI0031CDD9C2